MPRKKSQESAIVKPALTDDEASLLIDDSGIVNRMSIEFDIETQHLNETAKRFLHLLKRYSNETEAQVVAKVLNAFVEEHLRGKSSRSQMLIEDALDQLGIEKQRIEDEMKAETRRIAEEKSRELENVSIHYRHFAG